MIFKKISKTNKSNKNLLLLLVYISFFYSGDIMSKNFELSSDSFGNNEKIPVKHSCKGISPDLKIHNVPEGAKSLVLVIDDPDAQKVVGKTFVHIIAKMAPDITKIAEGQLDLLAKQEIQNDANHDKYYGPCSPEGQVHKYYFTIVALGKDIDLSKHDVDYFRNTYDKKSKFYQKYKNDILGQAQLVGKFKK